MPRKNIRLLGGKPLIAYAIQAARKVLLIDKLIVSTEDNEIAKVARQFGAEVPFMRPAELAADDSLELLSWKHAINTMETQLRQPIDIIVSVPTTSPLRKAEDIEACLKLLMTTDADVVITTNEARRNPYYNMVILDEDQNARLVIPSKKGAIVRRQEAPPVYDLTTVSIAARTSYVKSTSSIMTGKVKTVTVPPERALDIDTPLDFAIAEFLMSQLASNN